MATYEPAQVDDDVEGAAIAGVSTSTTALTGHRQQGSQASFFMRRVVPTLAIMAFVGTLGVIVLFGAEWTLERTLARDVESSKQQTAALQTQFSAIKSGSGGGGGGGAGGAQPPNVPPPFYVAPEPPVDRVLREVGSLSLRYEDLLSQNSGLGGVALPPYIAKSIDGSKTQAVYGVRNSNYRCPGVFNTPPDLPAYDSGIQVINLSNLPAMSYGIFVPLPQHTSISGSFVIEKFNTTAFQGNVLVIAIAACRLNAPQGILLFNINDALNPIPISPLFGDNTMFSGSLQCLATQLHHVHELPFGWSHEGQAYLVALNRCRRDSFGLSQRQVFIITDPASPQLWRNFEDRGIGNEFTYNVPVFPVPYADTNIVVHWIHRNETTGKPYAMASIGYVGWAFIDLSNASRFSIIQQSVWTQNDPILRSQRNAGSPNCALLVPSKQLVVATHFSNGYNPTQLTIQNGPVAGYTERVIESIQNQRKLSSHGKRICGIPVYVGYACPASASFPLRATLPALTTPGDEYFAIAQRGPVNDPNEPIAVCGYAQKMDAVVAAGYTVVVFPNHHEGSKPPGTPEFLVAGAGIGNAPFPDTMAFTISHSGLHYMFNKLPVRIDLPYLPASSGTEPAIGDIGARVCIDEPTFRGGYGYAHLLDATKPEFDELAQYHPLESFGREPSVQDATRRGLTAYGCAVPHPTDDTLVAQSFPAVGTKFLRIGGSRLGLDSTNDFAMVEVAKTLPVNAKTGAAQQLGNPLMTRGADNSTYMVSLDLTNNILRSYLVPDNL